MVNESKQSIFVVDDDQGILDSFDAMLGDDYPLTLMDSSKKALQVIAESRPELLFLDIKMPGINGLEVLQWMRENKVSTKVVIVTALPQDRNEEIARQYGVYRYLKKPFDVDEIEDIAKTALN